MPALATLLGELITFVSRLFFLFKDLFIILKYNLLYFARILIGFFPWLADIGNWLWSFLVTLPGHLAEASMTQFAALINLAVGASCCGFLADAVSFPDVVSSVGGLAYFTAPFRLEYGIGIIICAYSIRFVLKWVPHIPVGKLPRLPGPKWPQLPGPGAGP